MADRTPLVYVASPITGDPWGCVRRATDAAKFLQRHGVHAYLPQLSVLHEMIDPQPYEHWIAHGLAMIERCDGLLRLTGESPGADREEDHAEALGLPILGTAQLEESPQARYFLAVAREQAATGSWQP